MSIHHTAEQLEAAKAAGDLPLAARIIRTHLLASGRGVPSIGDFAKLARLYWSDPTAALDRIQHWQPTGP